MTYQVIKEKHKVGHHTVYITRVKGAVQCYGGTHNGATLTIDSIINDVIELPTGPHSSEKYVLKNIFGSTYGLEYQYYMYHQLTQVV